MELIEALNWRYATKKMNGQAVPQDKVDRVLEAARLAPSSAGIQAFSVIVVTNPELKKQILPIANNQSQIMDSSHLLIFAAWDTITKERIEGHFENLAAQRGVPLNSMDEFKNRLIGLFTAKTAEENFQHAARQAYISFGMALTAAALEKVDSTPMEGFNPAELDKLLNLKEKGLRSVALLPLGYRDEANDWLVNLKKVRQGGESFVINFN